MFTEGSVYDPPRDDDGVRCLVMRTWPRGVAYERVDVWLKELGPAADQLRGLEKGQMNWATFAAAYIGVVRPNRRKFCRPSSEPAPIAFQAIRISSPLVRETSTVWLAHGSP